MTVYHFTSNQLVNLLSDVIGLRDEYIELHGYDHEQAVGFAIIDTIEGLDAERDLVAAGELHGLLSQTILEDEHD